MRKKLSKSGLNRRIHQIAEKYWKDLLEFIQKMKNGGKLPLANGANDLTGGESIHVLLLQS